MIDDMFDNDDVLADLTALRGPEPDAGRADRTRERCHRHLALRRRRRRAVVGWFLPRVQAAEAALLTALSLVFLGGAVQRAVMLLGR